MIDLSKVDFRRAKTGVLCTAAWYPSIEERVPTGDGRGHGYDVGSDEWKSVVAFKLGIRGKSDLPRRDSEAWCRLIDQPVSINHSSSGARGNTDLEGKAAGPSFACDKVKAGSIEATVCDDEVLSALDRNRLVSNSGPISFICDGNPAKEVVVTFFRTDSPTLIAEHGDSASLMYLQPSGSGSKYKGRNESFWEH
jgi:hypothetical protein